MKPALAVLSLILALPAAASDFADDRDLSNPRAAALSLDGLRTEGALIDGVRVFPLTQTGAASGTPGYVSGRVPFKHAKVRLGTGAWIAAGPDGTFRLTVSGTTPVKIRVSLDNRWWVFRSMEDEEYQWETPPLSPGADAGLLEPAAGTEHAKLGAMHRRFTDAADFLAREASLAWWPRPLTVHWPAESDYFQGWRLHISDALAWDVVLHEFGHAVMYGAMDARGAGGFHKIDECYSAALAWSEGWASFFAAAVAIPRDDADAKFEFMVPRRRPIRVENVPEKVCAGPTNEWRVFAGLWDVYDSNADSETSSVDFGAIWKAVTSGTTGSVQDAWALIARPLDPLARRAAEDALIRNTLLPARAPAAKTAILETAAAFDGR